MFDNFLLGTYEDQKSFVHDLDPRTKIILLCILSLTVMLIQDFPKLILLLVFAVAIIYTARISIKRLIKSTKPILMMLIITYVMHVFFGNGEALAQYGPISISKEGLHQATIIILRLIILITLAIIVTSTTPLSKLTRSIEKLLRPLKIIRINPSSLALMIGLSIRCIPVFFTKAQRITQSLRARGMSLGKGTMRQRIHYCILVMKLLLSSLDQFAHTLSISMRMRGFHPTMERTSCYAFAFSWRDSVAVCFVAVIVVVSCNDFFHI